MPATKTGTRLVPGTIVGETDGGQVLAEEWYANHGIELVGDQRTGRIIYAAIGPRKTLRAPGGEKDAVVLLDSERIAFTTGDPEGAGRARRQRTAASCAWWGGRCRSGRRVAGFVLAVVGVVLVVRGRPHPETSESSQQPLTM